MMRSWALVLILAGLEGFAQGGPPLTEAQVVALVKIQTPDVAVRQEIETRGLAFRPDEAFVRRLRGMGAGGRTLELLLDRATTTVLAVVNAPPGAEVIVDGVLAGRASAEGSLAANAKGSVPHEVEIRADRRQTRTVTVPATTEPRIAVDGSLEWAVGFVTIHVPVGASVDIPPYGTFQGPAVTRDLPPASYTVKVSAPNRLTRTFPLQVEAGKPSTLDVTLPIDEFYGRSKVDQARSLVSSGATERARGVARALLELQPDYGPADALLAEAAYTDGLDSVFLAHALRALANGGGLLLNVKHHHALGSELHFATLGIDRNGLSYHPGSAPCALKPFALPWSAVLSSEVTGNAQNEAYLKLTVPKQKGTAELKFAHVASEFTRGEKGVGGILSYRGWIMVSPSYVAATLQALRTAIARAAIAPEPAQQASPLVDFGLSGAWAGSVKQERAGDYPVTVDFIPAAAQERAAAVTYPTLACTSEWILVEQSGDTVQFAERITGGANRCIGDGVLLKKGAAGIQVDFTYKGRTLARGMLTRRTGAGS